MWATVTDIFQKIKDNKKNRMENKNNNNISWYPTAFIANGVTSRGQGKNGHAVLKAVYLFMRKGGTRCIVEESSTWAQKCRLLITETPISEPPATDI